MTREMRSFTVAWRKWEVLKAQICPQALSLTSGLTPHLSSPSVLTPSVTSQSLHCTAHFSTETAEEFGTVVCLESKTSGTTDNNCEYFTMRVISEWMLFISHSSSQNIVLWHSLECERGRKTINYFWLTFSICVCVCRGGLLCGFFHRTSGLNWVNWHLAIWSDSPALCGSLYDSKISAVRLSAWAVILLEVLTPLLAGISARCVNGNTKKSIVWCRVGRE